MMSQGLHLPLASEPSSRLPAKLNLFGCKATQAKIVADLHLTVTLSYSAVHAIGVAMVGVGGASVVGSPWLLS